MWNSVEKVEFSNISASTTGDKLRGGNYGITISATWGGGNVALQRLSIDGTSWITVVTAFTANGYANVNLPSGTYRLAVTTASAIYCDIVSTVTAL